MNVKRTATIIAGGGALAAWLAAAATSGIRDAAAPLSPAAPAVDARSEVLASEIAKLHDRLHPSTTPSHPARNLFQFVAAPRALPPAPVAAPAALVVEAPAARVKAPPPIKLDGIAEDRTESGPVRTAIVTAQGQLFLVKEGESIAKLYRVQKISDEVVELVDLADGATIRLALP